MHPLSYDADPRTWAEAHFSEAELFDERRTRRLETIAAAMASNPGASLPRLFARASDVKAAYTFFGHPDVDPDAIQQPHRELVREAMRESGTYLLVEDTTQVDFSARRAKVPGLGPIGNRNDASQGLLLHSVLALRWAPRPGAEPTGRRPSLELLGLADQQFYLRRARPAGEPDKCSIARQGRARESQLWERTVARVGPAAERARWVRVSDAGSDVYENLLESQAAGFGYVIRSAQDRAVLDEDGPPRALYTVARAVAPLGEFTLEVAARAPRSARVAELAVSSAPVRLRSPRRPGVGLGTREPIRCWVVRVWEPKPPTGEAGLEWILLTDAAVTTLAGARDVAEQYATRWLAEDYHKALKTGLRIEQLQLETGARLFAAIAVCAVVALRLLEVRERARLEADAPAEASGLSDDELEVLRLRHHRPIATVRDVALAIGRMGGHLNRARDGMPGWQTLWHGFTKLASLVEGYRLARNRERFGE
jgi:hypothetical protein